MVPMAKLEEAGDQRSYWLKTYTCTLGARLMEHSNLSAFCLLIYKAENSDADEFPGVHIPRISNHQNFLTRDQLSRA